MDSIVNSQVPELIIPGYSRCGTTWLYSVLKHHNELFLPERKEVHYFDRYLERGIDWYSKQFVAENKIKIDITPGYCENKNIASLIHSIAPESKILIIIRNPIKRMQSIYKQKRRDGQTNIDYKTFLKYELNGSKKHLYYETICQFMEYYSSDRIKCLVYEDMIDDQEEYLRSILKFIDVEYLDFIEKYKILMWKKVNKTFEPKFKTLHKYAFRINRYIRKQHNRYYDYFLNKMVKLYKNANYTTEDLIVDSFEDEHKQFILDQYFDDIDNLSNLLRINLRKKWKID